MLFISSWLELPYGLHRGQVCFFTQIEISILKYSIRGLFNCCVLLMYKTEISCWMWTGEMQSTKMRIRYLEAALNQDVCYFDTEVRTSDVIYAINADAVIVQDAISEKVCNESLKLWSHSQNQFILLFFFQL